MCNSTRIIRSRSPVCPPQQRWGLQASETVHFSSSQPTAQAGGSAPSCGRSLEFILQSGFRFGQNPLCHFSSFWHWFLLAKMGYDSSATFPDDVLAWLPGKPSGAGEEKKSGTENDREIYFIMMSKKLMKTELWCDWLQSTKNGHLWDPYFFCCTVLTTVGYDEMYPVTKLGKFACMLYALFGIPLKLLVLTAVGDALASILCKVYNNYKNIHNPQFSLSHKGRFNDRNTNSDLVNQVLFHVEAKKPSHNFSMQKDNKTIDEILTEQHQNVELFKNSVEIEPKYMLPGLPRRERSYSSPDLWWRRSTHHLHSSLRDIGKVIENFDIPISLIAITVVAYISFGAAILPFLETQMDFGTAFYFCFVTFTTIGFGDIWLDHEPMLLFCSIYIIIGMEIIIVVIKMLKFRLLHAYQTIITLFTKWEVYEPVEK
ncbi:LOW QUALITY PROTEIN: potassium channel subfamily K member 18 [Macrotis lagotis]|uniref:LOW QUALITY PROTEIN: potassium channel subfamily K member 18 n=1 Tax=Macrotis lagotis TaxID=92651 RepID=UPI003D680757